jgi:hypothetical protein
MLDERQEIPRKRMRGMRGAFGRPVSQPRHRQPSNQLCALVIRLLLVLMVPEDREQQNDRQRYAQQPEQCASSKAHSFLLG